jgi:hypothetical protein
MSEEHFGPESAHNDNVSHVGKPQINMRMNALHFYMQLLQLKFRRLDQPVLPAQGSEVRASVIAHGRVNL